MFKKRPLVSCVAFLAGCFCGVFAGNTCSCVEGYRVGGPMSNKVRPLVCVGEEMFWFIGAGNSLGMEVVGHCSGELVMS